MTEPKHDTDADLAPFFAAARATRPVPSDDLIARIMADAATAALPTPAPTLPAPGIWARLSEAIGGWPSLAGLATAAVTGLWIGVAQPAALSGFLSGGIADDSLTYEFGDLMPGLATIEGEG